MTTPSEPIAFRGRSFEKSILSHADLSGVDLENVFLIEDKTTVFQWEN